MGNGTITMTGAEYDALASKIATLEAENAKLKGEYEWVASINTALDESNQSAWAENAKLRAELERRAIDGYALVPRKPTPAMRVIGARDCSALIQPDQAEEVWLAMLGAAVVPAEYAFPPSAPSAPKADDPVKQMLLEALEKVDSEHEILGWMKACELRRGRGSFGIAVMSDELALDWQSHQKNLERLIGLRLAAIAAARKGEEV